MRRPPIRMPDREEDLPREVYEEAPSEIILPPPPVIDAGAAKFQELAKLHWPSQEGGFKLTGFDMRNDRQLRIMLGLVYMAMREAENGEPS